jgi:hypothetical protein
MSEPKRIKVIAPQEQQRRREITVYARRMVESEGLKVPDDALAEAERFVAGEIDQAELSRRL